MKRKREKIRLNELERWKGKKKREGPDPGANCSIGQANHTKIKRGTAKKLMLRNSNNMYPCTLHRPWEGGQFPDRACFLFFFFGHVFSFWLFA